MIIKRRGGYATRIARASPAERQRWELAKKRIRSVLTRHVIANHRTLEQKIADAGPINQRINPHALATAFNMLELSGELSKRQESNGTWLYLTDTPLNQVQSRLSEQLPFWLRTQQQQLTMRIGQTLEISVYRAMRAFTTLRFLGAYTDLNEHEDCDLYVKEEPPSSLDGHSLAGKEKLDFIVSHPTAGWAGIEVKNKREWMYPSSSDTRELLSKCLALDAIPVLIARRIPFVTFRVLSPCGLVIHQTYNQRLPASEHSLAEKLRDKTLLGYHDIRLGNEPDARLKRFFGVNLPKVLQDARGRFDQYRDLLERYARGTMPYEEFAARVRRRQKGIDEDHDPSDDEDTSYTNSF